MTCYFRCSIYSFVLKIINKTLLFMFSLRKQSSRLQRIPGGGKTHVTIQHRARLVKSAPSSISSIVYRQFNREQEVNKILLTEGKTRKKKKKKKYCHWACWAEREVFNSFIMHFALRILVILIGFRVSIFWPFCYVLQCFTPKCVMIVRSLGGWACVGLL